MFVAVGHQGVRYVSSDGTLWKHEARGRDGEVYRGVAFGRGRFAVVGTYGGDNIFAVTQNGDPWQTAIQKNMYGSRLMGVGFGADTFMAVAGDAGAVGDSKPAVLFSTDGSDWSLPLVVQGKNAIRRIAFGNGRWVGVGDRGRRTTSVDGRTWEDPPMVRALDTLVDIAFGNGVFVGVGLHGLRMSTRDGLNWSERQSGLEGEHLNAILWAEDRFVAVGLGATYFSPDGEKWERRVNENAPLAAAYGGGVYVGTAWRGRMLRSRDALRWEQVFKGVDHLEACAYGKLPGE